MQNAGRCSGFATGLRRLDLGDEFKGFFKGFVIQADMLPLFVLVYENLNGYFLSWVCSFIAAVLWLPDMDREACVVLPQRDGPCLPPAKHGMRYVELSASAKIVLLPFFNERYSCEPCVLQIFGFFVALSLFGTNQATPVKF